MSCRVEAWNREGLNKAKRSRRQLRAVNPRLEQAGRPGQAEGGRCFNQKDKSENGFIVGDAFEANDAANMGMRMAYQLMTGGIVWVFGSGDGLVCM